MKKLLVFFLFFTIVAGYSQKTTQYGDLRWYLDYEEAKAVAKKENKPIVILFTGSDWCPPCKALRREVFSHPDFRKEADNVILVLADFPRRQPIPSDQKYRNKQLAMRFLGRSGLPTMVAVDWRNDQIIQKITGYNFYKHDIQPHLRFMRAARENYQNKKKKAFK